MEKYNFSPNVIYFALRAPDKSRQVTKQDEFNIPLSVLALGGRTTKYDLSCPRAKCQQKTTGQ